MTPKPSRLMSVQELLQSIAEQLQNNATVKTVFGDPVTANHKTIIPVARVAYGFGGGGQSTATTGDAGARGAGGGGGVRVMPAGIVEVTADSTRFIPIGLGRRLIGAAALALLAGYLMGRRGL